MPRARLISPDFWTSEAVVDCAPMTRLLLLGLSTFADDLGVLPLRPRTLRLQVFPGDAIDDDQMRVLIEELAARGLVRRYTVEGAEYLSIVDWAVHQRVSRRARRRYPADPSRCEGGDGEALKASDPAPDDSKPLQRPSSTLPGGTPPVPDEAANAAWRTAIEEALRRGWAIAAPDGLAHHVERWRADGRDLVRDVLPAIDRLTRVAVEFDRPLRLELLDGTMASTAVPIAMGQTIGSHSHRTM